MGFHNISVEGISSRSALASACNSPAVCVIPKMVYDMDKESRTKKVTRWHSDRLLDQVRSWPKSVREQVGRQLNKVEFGGVPDDFKPMRTIGPGVAEIRLSEMGDQFRLIYVAKFEEAIYVIHAITRKKSQKTSTLDMEVARKRYSELVQQRKLE